MITIGLAITAFFTIVFILIMVIERRTLFTGFSFLCMLGSYALLAMLIVFRYSHWITAHRLLFDVILFGAFVGVVFLVALPIVLVLMFFVEGIKIIRKEGFKWTNCLSLGLALLVIITTFVMPSLQLWKIHPYLFKLWSMVELLFAYLLFMATMYVVSALLNLMHLRKNHHFDYVVVLGAGVIGSKVTPLLAARIEKGMEICRANPDCQLIMSGGQGPGEDLPEGEAMAKYAIAQQMPKEHILIENKSTNTIENLHFSQNLMKQPARFAIVTTSYHVFRSLIIARKQHIKCVGYGAKTKWYFTLDATIREFIGYLSLTRKMHIVFIILLELLIVGLRIH